MTKKNKEKDQKLNMFVQEWADTFPKQTTKAGIMKKGEELLDAYDSIKNENNENNET